MENEMREGAYEPHPTMKQQKSILKKIPKHNWAITTYILAVLAIVLIVTSFTGGITGNVISDNKAGETSLEIINGLYSSYGLEVELVEVKDIGNLYEVILSSEGQEIPVYITKDGRYFGSMNSISEIQKEMEAYSNTNTQQTTQPNSPYSEEDLEEIKIFNECLAENNFVVYGASWCGYCKQVVATLGGYDIASPVYVECTEEDNEALCAEKLGGGYPTIRVDDELYQGARTLEAFSQATGCSVPNIN